MRERNNRKYNKPCLGVQAMGNNVCMSDRLRIVYWDYIFLLWFLTESWFNHTIIGTLGQASFMIYSLYRCLSTKQFHWSVFFVFYGLFCIVCYANLLLGFAIYPERSSLMIGVVFRNFVFIYFLYQYILNIGYQKFLLFFVQACCISSLGILLLVYSSTGGLYLHDEDSIGVINANIQSVLDGFIIAWLIISKRYKGKYFYILCFLFIFILLSGTKKSIITIFVIVGGNLLLKNPKYLIRNVVLVLVLFVFLYVIIMKVPIVYEMIGSRFETLLSFMEGGDTDDSTKTRDNFIEIGMYFWSLNPIWGHGLHSFGVLWGDGSTYSHNNYVELLCSVGIVGAITYYLIYLIALIKLIKLSGKSLIVPYAISILLSCLVSDYALVSYFERVLYIPIVLIYVLLNECKAMPQKSALRTNVIRLG